MSHVDFEDVTLKVRIYKNRNVPAGTLIRDEYGEPYAEVLDDNGFVAPEPPRAPLSEYPKV